MRSGSSSPARPADALSDDDRPSTADALAAVRRLSFAMLEARDPSALYETFATELFEVFGVDRVHVARMVGGRDQRPGHGLRPGVQAEAPSTSRIRHPPRRSERRAPRPRHAARHCTCRRPRLDADRAAVRARFGGASVLYMPLGLRGPVRSVVVLVSQSPRDVRRSPSSSWPTRSPTRPPRASPCSRCAAACGRAEPRSAALARAARSLNAQPRPATSADDLCARGRRALGADVAGFYLGDAEGGSAVAGARLARGLGWWGARVAPGEGDGRAGAADRHSRR